MADEKNPTHPFETFCRAFGLDWGRRDMKFRLCSGSPPTRALVEVAITSVGDTHYMSIHGVDAHGKRFKEALWVEVRSPGPGWPWLMMPSLLKTEGSPPSSGVFVLDWEGLWRETAKAGILTNPAGSTAHVLMAISHYEHDPRAICQMFVLAWDTLDLKPWAA